jgi:hypothetical protein
MQIQEPSKGCENTIVDFFNRIPFTNKINTSALKQFIFQSQSSQNEQDSIMKRIWWIISESNLSLRYTKLGTKLINIVLQEHDRNIEKQLTDTLSGLIFTTEQLLMYLRPWQEKVAKSEIYFFNVKLL